MFLSDFLVFLSDSSATYGSNRILTYQKRTCKYKNRLFPVVSKCSNTVSPEDGVAYTETCWELYETWYIVFLMYDLVKNNTDLCFIVYTLTQY
jgi:hypothetical protein